MELFTSDIISELLENSLDTAEATSDDWKNISNNSGSVAGKYINWLTFKDNAKSVVEDVQRICKHPLVPKHIHIYGYIYDCKTGLLIEVPEANEAGRTL
jgi:carbonic anhydrase